MVFHLSLPCLAPSHLTHVVYLFIRLLKKHLLKYLPVDGEPLKFRENIFTNMMQAADRGHKLDVYGPYSAYRCFIYHSI